MVNIPPINMVMTGGVYGIVLPTFLQIQPHYWPSLICSNFEMSKNRVPRINIMVNIMVIIIWLVVSNMTFIFHHIWDVILPRDSYFSRWLLHHQPAVNLRSGRITTPVVSLRISAFVKHKSLCGFITNPYQSHLIICICICSMFIYLWMAPLGIDQYWSIETITWFIKWF